MKKEKAISKKRKKRFKRKEKNEKSFLKEYTSKLQMKVVKPKGSAGISVEQ